MVLRAAGIVTVCYLALSLALGMSQPGWLWFHGQHATPQQWRMHDRLERRGVFDHHRYDGSHTGHAWGRALLAAEVSASLGDVTPNPLDGTACALHPPAPVVAVCLHWAHDWAAALSARTPALSPPRTPPRIG